MYLATIICKIIDTTLILLVVFAVMAGILVGLVKAFKGCRRGAAFLWTHRRTTGVVMVILILLGAVGYAHSVRVEQENDRIREVVFRDALTHYGSLVLPKPDTLYVLYQMESDPVSPVVVHNLHATFPQVITGGDPEFYNASQCRNFEVGDIEYYGPEEVRTYVNCIMRGLPSKGAGLTDYILHWSGDRWAITKENKRN